MNKQEAIEKLKSKAKSHWLDEAVYGDNSVKAIELNMAIDIVNQIDEPEKPVLTKEEAEWIEKLRELNPCTDEMIATISHRHADCDFVFKMSSTEYKLHFNQYKGKESYGMVRNRLLRAVLYGYEVKKRSFIQQG
nr:hypothetical protein [Streptococcus lutetiensis]